MNCIRCQSPVPSRTTKCPTCGQWQPTNAAALQTDKTVLLSDVVGVDEDRIATGPWDSCFGGGLVRKSTNLIGGPPGAGKSSFFLQLADAILDVNPGIGMYVATEENPAMIKSRADRYKTKHLARIRVFETKNVSLEEIEIAVHKYPVAFMFFDSAQGFSKNHADQVYLATMLKKWSDELSAPVVISCQINKGDDFAGAMALQHEVDCTLTLFADEAKVRHLETVKNRNGPDGIVEKFHMLETGLLHIPHDEESTGDDDD